MFTKLEFLNFRSFKSLNLADLGRVNLIVGRNNAGKTSLLEGIALLANPDVFTEVPGLFRTGGNTASSRYYRWLIRDEIDGAVLVGFAQSRFEVHLRRRTSSGPSPQPPGPGNWLSHGVEDLQAWWKADANKLPVRAISIQQRAPELFVASFAEAVRPADGERQMEELLRSIDDRIRNIRIDFSKAQNQPFIAIAIGLSERLPLTQIGQGIYRLVSIFSDLLGQRPKIVLIDEIENGIHHSAMAQVWKGIAEVAERLDVQVFATTHSHECLVAAHEVFSARSNYDLRVIQLYRTGDCTDGRVLPPKLIGTGIEEAIELR